MDNLPFIDEIIGRITQDNPKHFSTPSDDTVQALHTAIGVLMNGRLAPNSGPTIQDALNACFGQYMSYGYEAADAYCQANYNMPYSNLLLAASLAVFGGNWWYFNTPVSQLPNYLN